MIKIYKKVFWRMSVSCVIKNILRPRQRLTKKYFTKIFFNIYSKIFNFFFSLAYTSTKFYISSNQSQKRRKGSQNFFSQLLTFSLKKYFRFFIIFKFKYWVKKTKFILKRLFYFFKKYFRKNKLRFREIKISFWFLNMVSYNRITLPKKPRK